MALGSPQWMYKSGEAFTIDQSLRFEDRGDSGGSYLSWTPSTTGNRKKWVFSCWFKRANIERCFLLDATQSGGQAGAFSFGFNSDHKLFIADWHGTELTSKAVYKDPSAWMHILLAWDTTQATESNRTQIYVNGSLIELDEQSVGSGWSGYPPEDDERYINLADYQHTISGPDPYASDRDYIDGYLAEVHFIDRAGSGSEWFTANDGTANSSFNINTFGEFGTYGEWKPIEVTGVSYGTNGFYLPFKGDYEVEGFNAVKYRGNGLTTQYIGGVGFKPGFVWVKRRNASERHMLTTPLHKMNGGAFAWNDSATNEAQFGGANPSAVGINSFDTDGFTFTGTDSTFNSSSSNYIAYCWDMGNGGGSTKIISPVGGGVTGTSEKKFGTAALSLNGSSRCYTMRAHDDFSFGTGDFTVECWIYPNGSDNYDGVVTFQGHASTTSVGYGIGYNASNRINWVTSLGNVTTVVVYDSALSDNNWHHVAVSRSSGVTKLFINGTEEDSATDTFNYENIEMSSIGVAIGRYYPTVDEKYFNGYMDEIRISNTARYTGTFSVATSEHTKDVYTKLLMHCNGAHVGTIFTDNSAADENTDGGVTSQVAANPTYGQSVVTWTGTGSDVNVGHGLSVAPDVVIVRNTASNEHWAVMMKYSYGGTEGYKANYRLNDDSAYDTNSVYWDNTAPTSSVFRVGNGNLNNESGEKMIAYCFAPIAGYSKMSYYIGSGSTDKVISGLGFRPAYVMIKRVNPAENWYIYDNVREHPDSMQKPLTTNNDSAEGGNSTLEVTFQADGFTCTGDNAGINVNTNYYHWMAFADKREYGLFLDQSGNNNDLTAHNLTESDISLDSPTNNFCVMNPVSPNTSGLTFSEGNLKLAGADIGFFGTIGVSSGKWYWEMHSTNASGNANNTSAVGIVHSDALHDTVDSSSNSGFEGFGGTNKARGYYGYDGNKLGASSSASYGATFVTGDIIGVALNLDDAEITFYKNNASQGVAFTSLGSGDWFPLWQNWTGSVGVMNFGQDSSFAGIKTPQGNQDGNEIGDFYYTPPTGFLALCTSNLPEPAVKPSEHFNTVHYTGTGAAQSIAVGLQPGLVWVKGKSTNTDSTVVDIVRGDHIRLRTINDEGEHSSDPTTDRLDLTSTGFDLFSTSSGRENTDDETYIAWNWKANTTPSKTYAVTVVSDSGNKFRFDGFGTSAVTLDLQEGGTYKFDQSHSSNSGHPFRFSTTSNGSHGGGSEYTTGVTTNGTPGNSGAYTQITVASGAATLYYYCTVHSAMGGQANTNSTSGSSNFSGTIQSNNFANVDAGFSISTYAGTGSNATIGHGLSKAPEMVIAKKRNTSGDWMVQWNDDPTDYWRMNTTNVSTDSAAAWNDTAPTATVWSAGDDGAVNGSGNTYVAYCFHSVEGYSKVGSYVAGGGGNHTFIWTGFRPAFLMLKHSTNASESWVMYNNKSGTYNTITLHTFADLVNGESSSSGRGIDFYSNGFKLIGSDASINGSGITYAFIAFAETPFKYSNAR